MPKVKLNEVAVECKETIKGETSLPVVGLEHLIPGEVCLTQWSDDSDNTFTKRFRKGQVLFGRRRAYLKKAAVAPFGRHLLRRYHGHCRQAGSVGAGTAALYHPERCAVRLCRRALRRLPLAAREVGAPEKL